jgi:hypothetical protein
VYDESSPDALTVLAAHVFFKALLTIPSLIRTWWSECKDRQLSRAVASFTASYFSPLIIAEQLAGIRSPSVLATLQGDGFTVKVTSKGAGVTQEIVAGYTVDEQQMDIALRIPSDYPLHAIEVKEVRRVAVDETKWRMWLLNIHQIAQVNLSFHGSLYRSNQADMG